MRISPSLKAATVALPTAAWVTQANPGTWSTIALVIGAAYIALAWVLLSPTRCVAPAPARPAAAARGCSEHRHGAPERQISRRPTRRGARDVRCPASRVRARARRSTRR